MKNYVWAANITKLRQAEQDVVRSGRPLTEESVKEAYVVRAGLVYDMSPEPEVSIEPVKAPVVRSVRRPKGK